MKKVLVFLLACFASTALFAQAHYTPEVAPGFPGIQMTIVAAVQFNGGDEVQNDNFELGVFVQGTETCRATKFPPQHHGSGHYV